tara:strand:- start:431 stop:907 length:477 start_codon:yes stop_codon:yes gene_type:complete
MKKFNLVLTQDVKSKGKVSTRKIETDNFKFLNSSLKEIANEISVMFAEMRKEQLIKGAKLSIPFNFNTKFRIGIVKDGATFYACKTSKFAVKGSSNVTYSNYSVKERVHKGEISVTEEADFKAKSEKIRSEIYFALCTAYGEEHGVTIASRKEALRLS